ncbi:hypothetical protein KIN20_034157 [Parelaphostrongylus tenuis]|uniref:Uncharacterized protein n=1 Tax=Parelaphostrongylus tenuis TaxID=148309 RepID=A0AAD5WJI3_PARTN|nr:hypothetical protein KIN20_034157 [Parelaphostrongylus tenuis]
MVRLLEFFMILLLATISTVWGCGVILAGQAITRTFNVTGFTLPVSMAYSTAPRVQAQFPGISTSEESAQAFVQRLVMQTVFDVLESQARNALLPDAVISAILGQLTVNINYTPLPCQTASPGFTGRVANEMERRCIIVGNTVTGICRMIRNRMCRNVMNIKSIPPQHLIFSGTLMTTNIIMANWSRMMWQNVVNRAVRVLTTGPFRSHFFSTSATVGGN